MLQLMTGHTIHSFFTAKAFAGSVLITNALPRRIFIFRAKIINLIMVWIYESDLITRNSTLTIEESNTKRDCF